MAERAPVQLGGFSYEARTGHATRQRLVNMYAETNPGTAKTPVSLICSPGLTLWQTVGDGPIRGLHAMGSALYVVSGGELYTVSRSGVATLVGSVGSTGHVRMTDNGTHVGIATNGPAYAANASEILELPESGLVGATYQDGYGISGYTPPQGEDWSGIRDSSESAVRAMYEIVRGA
jgi:hypothetical protein